MTLNKGVFTISIDLELAWGIADKPISADIRKCLSHEREIVKRLLELFNKYNISATWGIVGHLLDNIAYNGDTNPLPQITRPILKNTGFDWFAEYPKRNSDPLWYGKDIMEMILEASPNQDICSHSYSPIPFDEKDININAAISDIINAKRIHEKFNLPFNVMIFPRNVAGFRKILHQYGIKAYRGKTKFWYDKIPSTIITRSFNLLYMILGITPKTVLPCVDEAGLISISDSMLLYSRKGIRRLIPNNNPAKISQKGLTKAIKKQEVFHLWFHPANFYYDTDIQLMIFEKILTHASDLRDNSQLDILTLTQIIERFRTGGTKAR